MRSDTMKIKEGFVLREVANQAMVIAVGEASKSFKGMIKMNHTSKDIWNYIKAGLDEEGVVSEMAKKYEVKEDIIRKDVKYIVGVLKEHHIIED